MTATPTTAPPANAQFGTVHGRFIVGVADGADADLNPDYVPAQGEILFTPSVPYVPNPSAPGGPVTMLKTSIRAVLDAEGYLCTANPDGTPGARGLKLLATDDANMLVTGWTWNVGYYFQSIGMTPLKVETHGIAVPGGADVDLTTTLKVPSTPGYGIPQAEAAALRAEAALADALDGFAGGDSIKVGGAAPSDGWWFDNGGVESVTAPAPIFTDKDGTAADTYTIPPATGVQYRVGGAERAAGTYPGSGSVTVTAYALPGYVLTGTASWSFTFSTATAPVAVTPTAPTASDTADTYTIPSMTGVEYLVGGVVQSAGTKTVGDVDATVTVTARALPGYTLTGTATWTFTFSKRATPTTSYEPAVLADNPMLLLMLDDPAGTTKPEVQGTLAAHHTFSLGSGGGTFGAAPLGAGATSLTLPGGSTSRLVLDQSKITKDGSNGAFWGVTRMAVEALVDLTSTSASAGDTATPLPVVATLNFGVLSVSKDGRVSAKWGSAEAKTGAGVLPYPTGRALLQARWDGATLTLYVNGVQAATAPLAGPVNHDWKLGIGNNAGAGTNDAFVGRFAGVAVWGGTADSDIPTVARLQAHAAAAGF